MNDSASAKELAERLTDAIFEHDVVVVRQVIAEGADVSAVLPRFPETPLELATRWHGCVEVIETLISAGAVVPLDALESLGDDAVTDWMIETEEEERAFAGVAELLVKHGADPNVRARNGELLIDHFPAHPYPLIHRVIAQALPKK